MSALTTAPPKFPDYVAAIWGSDLGPPDRFREKRVAGPLLAGGERGEEYSLLIFEWPKKGGLRVTLNPCAVVVWERGDQRSTNTPEALRALLNRIESARQDVRRGEQARERLSVEAAELAGAS